ncbi:hypothetical protein D3272_08100 [Lichenibacterium ramalinae]|uniref:BrnT family toxin n=1 Tax=Lichenibacterium ramalinae TaxID=2316527 RepID=A0A4Q2RHG9_9HYPH|nr:hypothetical protein D3272_08100 [Lichenibacterium ramalinae]
MHFTWDEAKREANLRKHGLDFADFGASFDRATALAIPTRASATGRYRDMLIGRWEHSLVVVVVVSPLGREALSLVSIRPARRQERDLYAQFKAPGPLRSEPALHARGLGRRGRQPRTEPS